MMHQRVVVGQYKTRLCSRRGKAQQRIVVVVVHRCRCKVPRFGRLRRRDSAGNFRNFAAPRHRKPIVQHIIHFAKQRIHGIRQMHRMDYLACKLCMVDRRFSNRFTNLRWVPIHDRPVMGIRQFRPAENVIGPHPIAVPHVCGNFGHRHPNVPDRVAKEPTHDPVRFF